jgi:hypothetical protein
LLPLRQVHVIHKQHQLAASRRAQPATTAAQQTYETSHTGLTH